MNFGRNILCSVKVTKNFMKAIDETEVKQNKILLVICW